MDLVSLCKGKLAHFRIKELKDVLTQLGKGKQGKKQDLVDRILESLADDQVSVSYGCAKKRSIAREEVAKIIDDIYRKMQAPSDLELTSKSHSGSGLNYGKPKEEAVVEGHQLETKVRCPCGSSLMSDSVIMCQDPGCRVWQHIVCVLIPENPMEGVQPTNPGCFHCETCRINRADPFWLTIRHLLPPTKLISNGVVSDGTNTTQIAERTFSLSRADKEMLQKTDHDLQVWCILLNDRVRLRMQWPQYAELHINGIPVRPVNRPGSQLLGINGRDDGPIISMYTREGNNRIVVSSCDARIFCFGVRIARRRTLEQVLSLVPKEADGERFEDALLRVRKCISGSNATENADNSDSDLEVVADSITVNLRCPMSGSRIRIAGRFKPCTHMRCFDLETFVELNQRSRKWQCPICLQNYSLENLVIDPYFNRITSLLKDCGEDVNEIEVKDDSSWRTKSESGCGELSQWHNPDGSLCVATNAELIGDVISRQIKQEYSSEGRESLKLGIKRNRDGKWEVRRSEDTALSSSGNCSLNQLKNPCAKSVPGTSSATGSYRDGEDGSVNQEFSLPLNHDSEFDSLRPSSVTTHHNIGSGPNSKIPDIIVLSDSEENDTILSFETAREDHQANDFGMPSDANHPEVSDRYPDGTSLLNNANDGFENSFWQTQTGAGFNLFDTGLDAPDPLAGVQDLVSCAPANDYNSAYDDNLIGTALHENFSAGYSDCEFNSSLVDNPLALESDDPSLQIFLQSKAGSVPVHTDMRGIDEIPVSIQSDDWISLTLAGGHIDSAPLNGLDRRVEDAYKASRMGTALDPAFSSMDIDRVNEATPNCQMPYNSALDPAQPQPGRTQFLSLDRDSE